MAGTDDLAQLREKIRDFRQDTMSSFKAMREDLADLRARIEDGFAMVDNGLTEMRGKLDAIVAGVQQIADSLNTHIVQQVGRLDGQ